MLILPTASVLLRTKIIKIILSIRNNAAAIPMSHILINFKFHGVIGQI
jgi:hypothetical protein